jgi:hypothetical protein
MQQLISNKTLILFHMSLSKLGNVIIIKIVISHEKAPGSNHLSGCL